jgi:UV DNA damage repair endonuclease
MDNTRKRIGFACHLLDDDGAKVTGTEVASIKASAFFNLSRFDQERKAHAKAVANCVAVYNLIKHVSKMPVIERMVRLPSDLLPLSTHPDFSYQRLTLKEVEAILKLAGEEARRHGVRLSFHPSQYVTLTAKDLTASIAELNWHVWYFEAMGYRLNRWHDKGIAINIHGGRKDASVSDVLKGLRKCRKDLMNVITFENDEFSWGIDRILELSDYVAVVFDLHHHWIHTNGEWLQPNTVTYQHVIDSWRGVRPKIHLSMMQQDSVECRADKLPRFEQATTNRTGLRKHSDYMWNAAIAQLAFRYLKTSDIMCEAKAKNLASHELASMREKGRQMK